MKHGSMIASVIVVFLLGLLIGKFMPGSASSASPTERLTIGDFEVRDISNTTLKPAVDMIVHKDPDSGWNVQFIVDNIVFAPSRVGEGYTKGEGYAHLYVDGYLTARIYGNWYHLDGLKPGQHELVVTLNSGAHETYSYKGNLVEDTQVIIQ